MIFCYLVVLTFYLWLNRGLPRTIVLPLPTSRIHLKTTLFILCQDPHAEEVDLLLSHAKGLMFRCILSSFNHFDLTITSGDKVYRLVTVYRRLYSRKAFLRTLYVLSVVDCYILSIPSFWWFQLSRHWQLKCKRQIIFWLSFFCWSVIPYSSSLGKHLGTGRRDVKKPFVLWNAP